VLLGAGYSVLNGVPRHPAVAGTASTQVITDDLQVDYDFRLIESYEELARALAIEASASFQTLAGGANARLNLYRSARMTSQAVYMLVRMSVATGVTQLTDYSLTRDARAMLARNPNQFYTTFGDSFVYRYGDGAELFALMEYRLKTGESRETLSAELNGRYGAFQAAASFSQSVQEITKNRDVKVQYAQAGGNWGGTVKPPDFEEGKPITGGVLTITPQELEYRIRSFVREARENPKNAQLIWADVLDYAVTLNYPSGALEFDAQPARRRLADLASYVQLLEQVRHTWAESVGVSAVSGSTTTVTPTAVAPAPPTVRDVLCLDDFIRRLKQKGEDGLREPLRITNDAELNELLPPSIALREYVISLISTPKTTPSVFKEPEKGFCNPLESLPTLEEYVVTRSVPTPKTIIPARFATGTAPVVGDHGTFGGKVVGSIPYGSTFAKPPRVFATAVRLADPNNDFAVFAVEVAGVGTDRFDVVLCKIDRGPGANQELCSPFAASEVAIQWFAIDAQP